MRLLLDTHAFLWWVADDDRLSPKARAAVTQASEVFLSVASCWEMAIKVSIHKLTLPLAIDRFVSEQLGINQFTLLALDLDQLAEVTTLPFHHRDPFDRVLAAQALREKLAIVSADPVFRKYRVKRIW